MRLSDVTILAYIEASGQPDFYDLFKLGDEIALDKDETARLWVGLTYFVQTDPELREQVGEVLRQLTGQAQGDAVKVLVSALGDLGMQDIVVAGSLR